MIFGALAGLIVGPLFMGIRQYPWVGVPFVALSAVVIHPIMNRDVPSLISLDMLKSARTYVALTLIAVGVLLSAPTLLAFLNRFYAYR
jgi:hypothetical protein